jgi:prepilin-type N-terminal cleavage/methylation domain-containing protein
MRPRTATGFTLIELAIVMLVIGMLIAGIMKGQELLAAARVRGVIQQQDGIKTAYFGFLDRFKAPPGDITSASALFTGLSATCGAGGNGNGNSRIEAANGESLLVWEHLTRSGFLTGTYACSGNAVVTPESAPRNGYRQYLQLIFDGNYAGAPRDVHNLKTGNELPSDLLAEVDRKIDDGDALRGVFRGSTYSTSTATNATCWDAATGVWNSVAAAPNCGGATLF